MLARVSVGVDGRDFSAVIACGDSSPDKEGVDLDADVAEAVNLLAADLKLPRSEVLQTIVRDWLISDGRLPADTLDEESETDGTA